MAVFSWTNGHFGGTVLPIELRYLRSSGAAVSSQQLGVRANHNSFGPALLRGRKFRSTDFSESKYESSVTQTTVG